MAPLRLVPIWGPSYWTWILLPNDAIMIFPLLFNHMLCACYFSSNVLADNCKACKERVMTDYVGKMEGRLSFLPIFSILTFPILSNGKKNYLLRSRKKPFTFIPALSDFIVRNWSGFNTRTILAPKKLSFLLQHWRFPGYNASVLYCFGHVG